MSISVELYKNIMRRWVAGVTVVTTRLEDETLHGITVSSFTSVSLDPALILICIGKEKHSHSLIQNSGVFAVNILSTDQIEIAKRFAGMYPEIEDRFADISYEVSETGSPILTASQGWMDCQLHNSYDAGDHTIFVGNVVAGSVGQENDLLLYGNRSWGKFAKPE